MVYGWIIALAVCAVASGVITGMLREFALKNQILDVASERSSHTGSVPRGGGVAIVAVFLVLLVVATTLGAVSLGVAIPIGLGSFAIALIGWMDDRQSLSPAKRALVHLAASVGAVLGLAFLAPQYEGGVHLSSVSWIWLVLVVVLVAWSINLYNFMDGIDGIASGQGVLTAIAASLIVGLNAAPQSSLLLAGVAGGCLGFLWWNRPPAKIFMGDAGSGFLGFVFASLAILQAVEDQRAVWVIPVLMGAFLADTGVTLLRRMIRGEKWYLPHRSHAYQQLAQRFGRHLPATLSVLGGSLAISVPAAITVHLRPDLALIAIGVSACIWGSLALVFRSGLGVTPNNRG